MPINIINGNIKKIKIYFLTNEKFGKILIDTEYPFGVLKMKNNNFDFNKVYYTETAEIKIVKPEWIC